jgi:quercetin dioxygenase-like cupin family protein
MDTTLDILGQRVIALWGEAVRARRIQGERITLALVELDPDAALPSHTHEAEQVGLCLRGSIDFDIDGERRTCGPGGAWAIRSRRPHQATAGPEGARRRGLQSDPGRLGRTPDERSAAPALAARDVDQETGDALAIGELAPSRAEFLPDPHGVSDHDGRQQPGTARRARRGPRALLSDRSCARTAHVSSRVRVPIVVDAHRVRRWQDSEDRRRWRRRQGETAPKVRNAAAAIADAGRSRSS